MNQSYNHYSKWSVHGGRGHVHLVPPWKEWQCLKARLSSGNIAEHVDSSGLTTSNVTIPQRLITFRLKARESFERDAPVEIELPPVTQPLAKIVKKIMQLPKIFRRLDLI